MHASISYFNLSMSNLLALLNRQVSNFFGDGG
jgi:hypothetical protein